MPFSGISTALATPFSHGQLDKSSFFQLLRFQIKEGVRQFVLASTTGESPTLEYEEVKKLCHWFKEFEKESKTNLKMILATGTASTKTTVEKSKKAEDLGVQALLVVTPYYNIPSQKGLLLHFEKTAKQSNLPVILYNVPSRTSCSLKAETIKELSQIDNIIGIKEATGDMEFLKQLKHICPKDFLLLGGDDPSCAEFFNLGGHGAISSGANVLAKELIEIFNSSASHRMELFEKYKNFLQELFKETNPIGVKQILNEMKVISSPELRLPLVYTKNPSLSEEWKKIKCNNAA